MANSTVLAQHVVGAASQGLGFRGALGLLLAGWSGFAKRSLRKAPHSVPFLSRAL